MRIVALVLAVMIASAGQAAADAAAHYRQGVAFEKAGAFDQAIGEYRKAYALDRKASHLFNIGRVFDQKGDARPAIEHYEKFLALDPNGPNAKDARAALALATKKLADQEVARKKAEEEAAAQAKKLAEEKERVRVAVDAHLKQAAELERRNAWASAGEEYQRAADVEGNPEHLIAAGEAYRKHPDLAKAKAAFQHYLEKVPAGPRSDEVRGKVADLAREIEVERNTKAKADAAAKAAADARAAEEARATRDKVVVERARGPKERARSRGWKFVGLAVGFGVGSAVFAYLGSEITSDLENGNFANGSDIGAAFRRGRLYNYLAVGSAVLGVAAVTIGGITVGINLGADAAPSSLAVTLRRAL